MRLPDREVQHRFLGKLESDEVFGPSVMFVGLDAAEEADALSHVHQGIAVGELTEVECPSDSSADGGATTWQRSEWAFPAAEELALREQDEASLE